MIDMVVGDKVNVELKCKIRETSKFGMDILIFCMVLDLL